MRTVFLGGRLLDGTGTEPLDGAGVVLDGDRIIAAGANDTLRRGVVVKRHKDGAIREHTCPNPPV